MYTLCGCKIRAIVTLTLTFEAEINVSRGLLLCQVSSHSDQFSFYRANLPHKHIVTK